MPSMDAFVVSLLVTLFLVCAAAAHPAAADAMATPTLAPTDYWQAVLPETPMPQAIHDLLTQSTGEEESRKVTMSYGSQGEEDSRKATMSYGSQGVEDLRKVTMSYGLKGDKDSRKITMPYGLHGGEGSRKVTTSYGSQREDSRKVTTSYGIQDEDTRKVTMSYGIQSEEEPRKAPTSYGSQDEEGSRKVTTSYGSQDEEGSRKVTMSYGSNGEEDPRKVTTSYGYQGVGDSRKVTMSYGFQGVEDSRKVTTSYGCKGSSEGITLLEFNEEEVEEHQETPQAVALEEEEQTLEDLLECPDHRPTSFLKGTMVMRTMLPRSPHHMETKGEQDMKKITMSYGSHQSEEHSLRITMPENKQSTSEKGDTSKGDIHDHDVRSHSHSHSHSSGNNLADVFFFHDVLRPGSVITPTIPPTTSLPSLLPRREADALPFSTERFPDILAMFAPTSDAMGKEIWWTLDTCENPQLLPGEKAACATSLESLAKLPVALLGTRNVRAFSGDMPTDPTGTSAQRGRYNVTAVRKLSKSLTAATCHDLTYPYAVFYCHTTNPVATYLVKLVAQHGRVPAMEALAVCHLDTSLWSPRHPFLVAHSIKPGDAVVCHFLSKLSIVWVPAGEQGGMREA